MAFQIYKSNGWIDAWPTITQTTTHRSVVRFFRSWIELKLKVVERTFVVCYMRASHATQIVGEFSMDHFNSFCRHFYSSSKSFHFTTVCVFFFCSRSRSLFLVNSFYLLQYRSLDDLVMGYLLFHLLKSVLIKLVFLLFWKDNQEIEDFYGDEKIDADDWKMQLCISNERFCMCMGNE